MQGSKEGKEAQAAEATPEDQLPAKEPEGGAPAVAEAATEKPANAAEETGEGGDEAGGDQDEQMGDAASPVVLEAQAPAEALLQPDQGSVDRAPATTPSAPAAKELEQARDPEIRDEPEESQGAKPGTPVSTMADAFSLIEQFNCFRSADGCKSDWWHPSISCWNP